MRENLDTVHLDEQAGSAIFADGDLPTDLVVGASLIFSPLKLRRPGLLAVKAIIDGEIVDISSLRVAHHADA